MRYVRNFCTKSDFVKDNSSSQTFYNTTQPTYTSPHMYRKIDSLESVPTRYEDELLSNKIMNSKDVEEFKLKVDKECDYALENWESYQVGENSVKGLMDLKKFPGNRIVKDDDLETGVEVERLRRVGRASVTVPEDFVGFSFLFWNWIYSRLLTTNS